MSSHLLPPVIPLDTLSFASNVIIDTVAIIPLCVTPRPSTAIRLTFQTRLAALRIRVHTHTILTIAGISTSLPGAIVARSFV